MKQFFENYREKRKVAFMDLEKTYDKVAEKHYGECYMNVELIGT